MNDTTGGTFIMYHTPTAEAILGAFIYLIGILGITALLVDTTVRVIRSIRARNLKRKEGQND